MERKRNPGPPSPHSAEPVIGRRFAPTRWLHAGYTNLSPRSAPPSLPDKSP